MWRCVALGELGGDELGGGAGDHVLAEAAHRRVEQRSSPHSQRPSRKAVRIVMSFLASAISWRCERTEWPTLSFRSHSRWSIASAARSAPAVGALAVRNMRSRSLNGAISPRPVPPRPTSASSSSSGSSSRRSVDEVVGQPDELVVEEGGGLGGGPAVAGLVGQPPRDLRAAGRQRLAQDRRRLRLLSFLPRRGRRAGRRSRGDR